MKPLNFDLSRTLFAQTKRDKKVLRSFFKSDRGYGASSPVYSVSFVSFSLRLYRQRKAAKPFCYQDLLDAFSFEIKGPKEKALQKENAVFCANAARAPLLKKWTKRRTKRVRTSRQIPICLITNKKQRWIHRRFYLITVHPLP